MIVTPANFFNMPESDVIRGPGGSPMLVPKGLEGTGVRSAYTRASYMADFLESKDHIHKWEMRYLAKAMGQNEDLAALAACEVYSTGISDAVVGREKSASGRRLDDIIERAFDRVRLHEKADRGTAVHGFTEPGFWKAEPHEAVPDRLKVAVAGFWEINRKECIELVGTEQFTANDVTMSAGTFDHLVRIPGHPLFGNKYVVADKKTGAFSPFEWVIQISSYANGDPYDTSTDLRPEWPGEICKEWGLVWQIDCNPGATDPKTCVKLWVIDLTIGWELAQIAARVRDLHESKGLAAAYQSPTFEQRLAGCHTKEDLRLLWNSIDDDNDPRRLEVSKKASHL